MSSSSDSFRSPNDERHQYNIQPYGKDIDESTLGQIDEVTIISKDGSLTVPTEMMASDRLKLRPRLGKKSLTDTIESANAMGF